MSPRVRRKGTIVFIVIACFYAGVAVGWLLHAAFTPQAPAPPQVAATSGQDEPAAVDAGLTGAVEGAVARPVEQPVPSAVEGPDPTTIDQLRARQLLLPVKGADVSLMEGGFDERRGGGTRGHEAVDILAPRHTPVIAVDSGTIAKLFRSAAGGITIYQFDPSARFCYYYAHLERYASGLREGQPVDRGDVIGYVGTTGNAPPDTPHLHFAVFALTAEKKWWEGRPIDPYAIFRP